MVKLRLSMNWLLWIGLLSLTVFAVVMLGSGLEVSQAATPLADVQVAKTVDVPYVAPGQLPAPLYTITFTNPNPEDVVLEAISDTLPADFMFVGMHPSSDWKGPYDYTHPDVIWQGPVTVTANSTLTVVYAVYVPATVLPSSTAYVNTVEAVTEGGQPVGPASARLPVGSIDLTADKTASSNRVLHGEFITYTAIFANDGEITGTLQMISDTLDPALTFVGMAAGSEVGDPNVDIVNNVLTWPGDFELPPQHTLTVKYEVQAPAGPGWYWSDNFIQADTGDEIIASDTTVLVGPEHSYVYLPSLVLNWRYAFLSVDKQVSLNEIEPGDEVLYTVTVRNEGQTTGSLLTMYDMLPAGFTYQGMAPESDIQSEPDTNIGTLTWTGPWDMPPGHEIVFIFRVTAGDGEGVFVNTANVTAQWANVQEQPASASVVVERGILLEDHFNSGIGQWTPFLNYWRLKEGQWYWGPSDGISGSGAATQNAMAVPPKEAEDGLLMYLGEGSDQWTNYRVEAKIILRTDNHPHGLWVRGQYRDVGDEDTAGWVTGYYIMVGGGPTAGTHYVSLKQLQTIEDCWDAACNNPQNLYDFNNPHELTITKKDGRLNRYQWYTLAVEVRGDNIKVWLDDVLYIDYTDSKYPFLTGTVGLKTYKAETVSFDDVIVTPLP